MRFSRPALALMILPTSDRLGGWTQDDGVSPGEDPIDADVLAAEVL